MKRFFLVAISLILAGVSALAAPNPSTAKVPAFPWHSGERALRLRSFL
jgi:hypothetical protein